MLCPSCSETFERAEEVEKDLIVAFIPFHSRPWRLVWERGTDSNIEPINNCEFCTFLVALLVSNQVSAQPSEGLIPDNPNAPLKGKFKPHVSSIKSYGSPYEGHYSYRISVQRGKSNGPGPRQPLTLFRLEGRARSLVCQFQLALIDLLHGRSSNAIDQHSKPSIEQYFITAEFRETLSMDCYVYQRASIMQPRPFPSPGGLKLASYKTHRHRAQGTRNVSYGSISGGSRCGGDYRSALCHIKLLLGPFSLIQNAAPCRVWKIQRRHRC